MALDRLPHSRLSGTAPEMEPSPAKAVVHPHPTGAQMEPDPNFPPEPDPDPNNPGLGWWAFIGGAWRWILYPDPN
jgi:hypothetical protein